MVLLYFCFVVCLIIWLCILYGLFFYTVANDDRHQLYSILSQNFISFFLSSYIYSSTSYHRAFFLPRWLGRGYANAYCLWRVQRWPAHYFALAQRRRPSLVYAGRKRLISRPLLFALKYFLFVGNSYWWLYVCG